ncbi:oxidoreductase [Metapseudomonas resinovorans]|uniref:aldo/keto reductase n=1 Tax=Metapseudomonas resinovorans TaxID=53412 RepID=UPI0009875034|nr:aldo/keto reductase [Pseudomonas resinovorans]GLZ84375.1 oxidoreductase [Pseudomonas resinovorans]
MRYKILGNTGLRVSELCLGTMTFGTQGWGAEEGEAARIFARFREGGGNFIDTANEVYAGGRSEEVVGSLIQGCREEMVLATKYSLAYPGGGNPNAGGNHRKSLRRSVEASLKRLSTDYIDLLWVHAWDSATPLEETLRALDDLVRQGKVLYTGISNAPAWVVASANTQARLQGWTSFAALQAEYNLMERSVEHDLLPMCRHFGLSLAAWSPLASGILSGKYSAGKDAGEAKRLDVAGLKTLDERSLAIAEAVGQVAQAIGRSPSQVALNWLRAQPGVIPLLGVRTLAQLEDNLGCLDFQLEPGHLATLAELGAPPAQYPHDYLTKYQELIAAGYRRLTDPN